MYISSKIDILYKNWLYKIVIYNRYGKSFIMSFDIKPSYSKLNITG